MKLWYQSMTREGDHWGNYPKTLRAILDKVKDEEIGRAHV